MKQKTYFIKTYGCQMNVADSEKLAAVLKAAGYTEYKTDNESSDIRKLITCDLILVNTCVVRQNAEDRAAWFVTSMKNLKEINPNLRIGLCGCIVTEPGRDVKKQFPHVDLFIGPNQPEKLKEFLSLPLSSSSCFSPSPLITIMTGCDNYCSYCIVPFVRGREYSRPMDEVLAEVKSLIKNGTKEIMLLGQNVNSYQYGLAKLLHEIGLLAVSPSTTLGTSRKLLVRFMTSHPRDMSDKLIETIHKLPFVAREFHFPLQSGDNEILKKMNRGYTFDYYLNRVEKIRSLMPKARITTDIMVGFPGETDEQFENSIRAVKKVKFREVFMFAYSSRKKTAAGKMPDQIPRDIKQKRLQRLIKEVRETVAMKD